MRKPNYNSADYFDAYLSTIREVAYCIYTKKQNVDWIRGLKGLAEFLGCCKTTAWKIHKSGILKSAELRYSRKIQWYKPRVIEALQLNNSSYAKDEDEQ